MCKRLEEPNSLFHRKVSEEAIQMLQEVTDEEIKQAMFDIGDNKAPEQMGILQDSIKMLGRWLEWMCAGQ